MQFEYIKSYLNAKEKPYLEDNANSIKNQTMFHNVFTTTTTIYTYIYIHIFSQDVVLISIHYISKV